VISLLHREIAKVALSADYVTFANQFGTEVTRWAEGKQEPLPGLMAELIAGKIDLLVTWTTPAAIAAKAATANTGIPVVVPVMGDPLATGVVTNIARPGGNLTGFALGHDEAFAAKWLQLLHEAFPHLSPVAVIFNPDSPVVRKQAEALKPAALLLRLKLHYYEVRAPGQFPSAFAARAPVSCPSSRPPRSSL
jgi:putative ABC transport system substrate-binding protein